MKKFLRMITVFLWMFLWMASMQTEAANVKYDQLIFVGDSRIVQMSQMIPNSNTRYIGKNGAGLSWLNGSAYTKLNKQLKKEEGRSAIVFFIGINDTWNVSAYAKTLNQYAKELEKTYECDVYFMSLTPTTSVGKTPSKGNAAVRKFNAVMKASLNSRIRYLDVHSFFGDSISSVDGVHYTDYSYWKIYTECVSRLSKYGKLKKGEYTWKYQGISWKCYTKNGKKLKSCFMDNNVGQCYLSNQGKRLENRTFTVKGKTYHADRFGTI